MKKLLAFLVLLPVFAYATTFIYTAQSTAPIPGFTAATATVSASTCATIGTYAGNGTAGSFEITTGGAACVFTVTLNGATGLTAPTGWVANADDVTNGVHCVNSATVSQTTVVFTCTAVSGDVLKWSAVPY